MLTHHTCTHTHAPRTHPCPGPPMQERIRLVKALFRDQGATEFIIATIPTVLGVNESSRLAHTLREEQIPCRRIIVNQIIGPGMGDRWGRWSVWVMVGGWG